MVCSNCCEHVPLLRLGYVDPVLVCSKCSPTCKSEEEFMKNKLKILIEGQSVNVNLSTTGCVCVCVCVCEFVGLLAPRCKVVGSNIAWKEPLVSVRYCSCWLESFKSLFPSSKDSGSTLSMFCISLSLSLSLSQCIQVRTSTSLTPLTLPRQSTTAS